MQKKKTLKYTMALLVVAVAVLWGISQGNSGVADAFGDHSVASGQAVSGQTVSGQAVTSQAVVESASTEDPRIVTTQYGKIEGKKTSNAYMWLGVPYGKTERWQAPTAPDPWSHTRSCKKGKTGKGDDCLFVNVYKPAQKSDAENLPVMVFLHGGGNVGGSANRNFSTFVEETEVIVVSVEFRQGAFGWFNSRGLKTGE